MGKALLFGVGQVASCQFITQSYQLAGEESGNSIQLKSQLFLSEVGGEQTGAKRRLNIGLLSPFAFLVLNVFIILYTVVV